MRIELSGVEFRYGNEPIVQDIHMTLESGSLTVICGQTGSGKSTLLQIIAGLEKPSVGSVHYEMSRSHKQHPRETIAIVFQMPESQLFAATVKADLEYGLALRKVPIEERWSRVEQAMRLVGLEPFEFLERSPYLLSGGEKRRVAIAGALALQPDVLILDEPTAALDPQASRDLREILADLRDNGITVIVSTHDLDAFFPLADQVVVLHKGRVAYAGDARKLMGEPNLLRRTGLDLPEAAQIAYSLRNRGIELPIPLAVEDLLPFLRERVRTKERNGNGSADSPENGRLLEGQLLQERFTPEHEKIPDETDRLRSHAKPSVWDLPGYGNRTIIERLDPRVKWFALLLLSLVILSIDSGLGIMLSTGLILVLLQLARISLRTWFRLVRPFLWMLFFFWTVSAVTFSRADVWLGPIGINVQGAVQGGIGVLRFLLIIILGIVFTETTSGAPLREGFEWLIRPLRKAGVPVRDVSLAVSITLQFVPWILETFLRLRKSLGSRGLDTIGMRKWAPNQLAYLFIPLLIAVIKMGDELAIAIESRGYNRQAERTSWFELRWTRNDTRTMMVTAIVAGILWWIG